jgi:hypothetical protein
MDCGTTRVVVRNALARDLDLFIGGGARSHRRASGKVEFGEPFGESNKENRFDYH